MPFPDEVSWVQEFMATQGREPTLADYVARKESERQVSETGQPVDQMWFDQFAERPEYQSLQDVQFLTQPGGFPSSGSGVPDPWARSEADPGDQMQRWAAMLGQVRGGATGEDVRQQYGNTEGPISESWLIENMNQLAQSNRPWEYNFPEQNRQAAVNLEPEPEPGEPFWHARVRQIEEWINSNMPEEMPKKEKALAGPPAGAGQAVTPGTGQTASTQARAGQAARPEPSSPPTAALPQQSPPPDFYASQTARRGGASAVQGATPLYTPLPFPEPTEGNRQSYTPLGAGANARQGLLPVSTPSQMNIPPDLIRQVRSLPRPPQQSPIESLLGGIGPNLPSLWEGQTAAPRMGLDALGIILKYLTSRPGYSY